MNEASSPTRSWRGAAGALAIVVAYLALLAWRYDTLPPALNNDAVQEVESGYRLVRDARFAVMAFEPSTNGVETLWVAIAGLLIEGLGRGTLAAVMSSWLAVGLMMLGLAATSRWLVDGRTERRVLDPVLLLLTCAGMAWLFHYGRSGMRCVSSATFLAWAMAGMALMLRDVASEQVSQRRWADWRGPLLVGSALALGMYAYTTSRAAALAYAIFAVGHVLLTQWRSAPDRRAILTAHARVVLVALLVSLPNVVYALREPDLFFGRGLYNVKGDAWVWTRHVIESALVPIHYDASRYQFVNGPYHLFDPAAMILPRAGVPPVWMWTGLLALGGVVWIALRWQGPARQAAVFGVVCYVTTCLAIGFTGPSLSRLAMLIPLIALAAAALPSALADRDPRTRGAIVVLLLATAGLSVWRYADRVARLDPTWGFATTARAMGEAAREQSHAGRSVMVLLDRDLNAFAYYASGHRTPIRAYDFFARPYEPGRITDEAWAWADVVLIERGASTAPALREAERRGWVRRVESDTTDRAYDLLITPSAAD